jgi:hypothetical protein
LRRQLQRVRERVIPFPQQLQPIRAAIAPRALLAALTVALTINGAAIPAEQFAGGRKAVFQVVAQRPQQRLVRLRVQPPHPRILLRFLDHAQPSLAAFRIEHQHPDIHPLVAHQVRRVAKHAVCTSTLLARLHVCLCRHLVSPSAAPGL